MVINSLLKIIHDGSLPYSKTHVVSPSHKLTISIDMLDVKTYMFLEGSESTVEIDCADIRDGIAHDVSITIDTSDGCVEIVDVK